MFDADLLFDDVSYASGGPVLLNAPLSERCKIVKFPGPDSKLLANFGKERCPRWISRTHGYASTDEYRAPAAYEGLGIVFQEPPRRRCRHVTVPIYLVAGTNRDRILNPLLDAIRYRGIDGFAVVSGRSNELDDIR